MSSLLFAQEPIHSSISSYIEHKSFENSKQKEQGNVYGLGVDLHYENSGYKIFLEHGKTQTKQPPLKEDVSFYKLFSLYNYKLNSQSNIHLHYLRVIEDNIAITDGGNVYGLGFGYKPFKPLLVDFTYYYAQYNDFKVKQGDFKVEYKTVFKSFKIKVRTTTKYIALEDIIQNSFTKNAQDHYVTTHFALHAHYKSYHLGMGTTLGDFAFGVMNDGFKLQHHAMKITQSYAVGIGKTFQKFVIRAQFITQKAEEIPMQNKNVKLEAFRLILNYKL